jgi:hypothetical protein
LGYYTYYTRERIGGTMPPPILGNFNEVRGALWLWFLLVISAPRLSDTTEEWVPVASGIPFQDEFLASQLRVSVTMVRRWRVRLEGLGYVRTESVPPRHRRFWILNVNAQSAEQPELQPMTTWTN